jgi:integrase
LAIKSCKNKLLLIYIYQSAGVKMANIRQLKSGNWNVQVRVAGTPGRSQTFHNRKDAEDWASKQESIINFQHPHFEVAGVMYCEAILVNKPSRKLTELQLKRIGKRTEFAKPLDKVTLQDVNSYKQKRLSEVSTTTTRDDLMLIRRIYRWYINEWLAKAGQELVNPCNRLMLPKARKVRDTVITRKQLGLLLREMTPLMAQVVELAFETAMRRSEILKLRECDLHLEDRFLRVVEGKEGSRDVPLTRRAVRLLEYAVARSARSGGRLYPMAAYSVSQAVRRARQELGMSDNVRFHQLRHSRITEVARMGLNLTCH